MRRALRPLGWILFFALCAFGGFVAGGCRTATDGTSSAAASTEASHLLDRMGRAEVTALMLCFRPNCTDADEAVKDRLNARDPFRVGRLEDDLRAAYQTGLTRFDDLDGQRDWPEPHAMIDWILDDALLVDADKPCDVDTDSYLDIEKAWLRGADHATCGGRTPNADAIDETMTLLINGPDRPDPRRIDGANEPAKRAINEFPYLRPGHIL
jgi:hypothetical protein